ncbi:MAG: hypothetical protein IJA02_02540 [Clostridia bacterium]|nr:hypothetical protein [Clostridia bacterium]
MKNEMHNYDIFPKVFPKDKEIEITIKPLGDHAAFKKESYQMEICPLTQGPRWAFPTMSGISDEFTVKPDADGCIRFKYTFRGEQEHFVRFLKEDSKKDFQFSVYSLDEDLCGRYPFAGDLHMHTCRSDGKQAPAIVAANYRRHGYDFLAITDHQRYYPSIEAINAFKDVPLEFTLVPGEEIHTPRGDAYHTNDVHMVNFGGRYSINALTTASSHIADVGYDINLRSIDGSGPDPISKEEFWALIDEYAKTIDIPEGVEPYAFACCSWITEQVRKADGLSIFAHPYWIADIFHVPEKFSEAMFEKKAFDAFEVLGGENYFEQNGFQSIFYYEQCAKGNKCPIVGSTDSHSSINNRNGFICSTIVFAPENTRESLIESIKDSYSVAVDTISAEYRMVGDLRLVKYASFLYENFFPLHDELCYEEGLLMKQYATGDEDAARLLKAINGRMKKQREKYFAF